MTYHCIVDFKYTLDPTAEEPIMLIDKHIGMDAEDGEGIMGDQFTRELMFLDTLNKKNINVWINSGGGVVTDGEQIFHAIIHSKTPVDTTCTGTAASIAGPIFAAGRKRTINDYAKVMMHPVSGGDEKSMQAFEKSICTMLSSRSFLNEDQVSKLMSRTSWIFPDEAKTMGLCTDIDYSHDVNVNSIDPVTASYKDYKTIVNKLIEDKKQQPIMEKVQNKLKLNKFANEDAMVDAIDSIVNGYEKTIAENKSKFDKFVDEMAESKKAKEDAENKYNELKARYEAKEKEETEARLNENKNKASELVKNAVSLGKIKNEAEVISEWEKEATADFAKTEKLLNGMTATKTAPVFNKSKAGDAPEGAISIDKENPEAFVGKMNAQLLAKAKNRFKI